MGAAAQHAASDYRPAKLVPVTDPIAVREATVRDYVRNAARAGIPVSTSTLEALAVHDCNMADAYLTRGVDLSPVRPKRAPQKKVTEVIKPKDDIDLAMKAAPPPATREAPVSHRDMTAVSARWPFAMGRLKRILAGATGHRDPIMVAMSCEVPELALDVLRLERNYKLRGRDSRHNPFRGLNEIDARRALVRSIEDICDRSTKWLGPWWVK
jgi:hypothetical protein